VAVAHRHDETTCRRLKTGEIISREAGREPPPPAPGGTLLEMDGARGEVELRQLVKMADGRWNPAKGVWRHPQAQARGPGLLHRIVGI